MQIKNMEGGGGDSVVTKQKRGKQQSTPNS